jgi:hypothetical protein
MRYILKKVNNAGSGFSALSVKR